MNADVSIIIPWRDNGNPNRQANLTRVLDHLAPLGWPLILAPDNRPDGTPFNRSAAYNEGVRLSPSAVYVWHEADMLVPLDQLDDAVAVAANRDTLVVPFTTYRYLSEEASRLVLSGAAPETVFPKWIMDNGSSVGAVGVCSADALAAVGQWDEKLAGHGYDDNAMWFAFRTACGPATFIEGDATHLYHPMAYAPWERDTYAANAENFSPTEVAATNRNRRLVRAYQAARTPEDVRALTTAEAPA